MKKPTAHQHSSNDVMDHLFLIAYIYNTMIALLQAVSGFELYVYWTNTPILANHRNQSAPLSQLPETPCFSALVCFICCAPRRMGYNHCQPNSSLTCMTPAEFAGLCIGKPLSKNTAKKKKPLVSVGLSDYKCAKMGY